MKRVLTAALLIPVIVYVVLWANTPVFFGVLLAAAFLSYYEFNSISAAYGFGAPGPLGYAAGLALISIPVEGWLVVTATALAGLALAMRADELAKALPRAALLAMGVVYVFGCWKYAVLLRDIGRPWLMYALLVSWAGDIGAYYVGRSFGRHKLAPRVSPKKSWEGAAASVVTSILLAGGYLAYFGGVPAPEAAAVTVLANAAGQIGDLAESAIKRGAGVKDSGSILPGHGGFLDRVDSTLFALPVVYAWARWAAR
jgi:phosphatidate cytidylyltransferase